MSQENVETVRQGLIATSGGNPEGADRVGHVRGDWLDGEARIPRAAGGRVPSRLGQPWRDWHFAVTDVRNAGEDRVFAAIHEHGVGTESEVAVEQDRYLVFTLRGGRVVRVQMFSERLEGLEAAGLRK